jgi:hypothetical protein
LGGPYSLSGHFGKEKNLLLPSGSETFSENNIKMDLKAVCVLYPSTSAQKPVTRSCEHVTTLYSGWETVDHPSTTRFLTELSGSLGNAAIIFERQNYAD